MRPAKIVAIVIGALLILVGIGVLASGIIVLSINGVYKDSSGFFSTSDRALSSAGYALVTPDVKLNIGSGDWLPGGGLVQIRATSSGTAPVFIGIGPSDQVAEYLDGVAYDEVTNPEILSSWFSSLAEYRHHDGGAPSAPPGQQTFWVAEQEGQGTQTVQWNVRGGDWTAVLMNADASAPVNASVSFGARLGFLLPLGIGLTVAGVVLLAVGIVLVVLGARRSRPPLQPGYPGGAPYGPPQQPAYQPAPYQQPPYTAPPYAPPSYQQPSYQPPPQEQPPQEQRRRRSRRPTLLPPRRRLPPLRRLTSRLRRWRRPRLGACPRRGLPWACLNGLRQRLQKSRAPRGGYAARGSHWKAETGYLATYMASAAPVASRSHNSSPSIE